MATTSNGRLYMKKCVAEFREVSQAKYGTPFDLDAIERRGKPLRSKKPLTYLSPETRIAPVQSRA